MRNVTINYDDAIGLYRIGLLINWEVKETRQTNNYHEIGIIVSNWLVNGY